MKWMENFANMPATLETTTDCHVNYLVLGSLVARDDKVANGRLYTNLILICCVNFNLTVTTKLYVVPKVL